MANAAHAHDSNSYYIPHNSTWPIVGSVSLFTVMLGAITYLNDWVGGWVFIPGVVTDTCLAVSGLGGRTPRRSPR